jgi:anti-sigma factor ChrR (cupin superfamily)
MTHPDFETLLRYVSEIASDEESVQVDGHLAECSECLEQVRLLDSLRETYGTQDENWTLPQLKAEYQAITWSQLQTPEKAQPARSPEAESKTTSALPHQRERGALRQVLDRWLQEARGLIGSLMPRPVLAAVALTAAVLVGLVLWWPLGDAGL